MSGKGTPEILTGSIEGLREDKKQEINDLIEINMLGIFNESSIVNVENEFQDFYSNLAGNEISWRGFLVSFIKPYNTDQFEINFRIKCKFEAIGEIRAQVLEYIHELGGIMGEIQSDTLASL